MAELAAREAAGESFWADEFDDSTRTKLVLAFRFATKDIGDYYVLARDGILHDEGKFFLYDPRASADQDLLNYLLTCDNEMMPTVVEAMSFACNDGYLNAAFSNWDRAETFDPAVNVILREHRVSYELTSHQMIPLSAKELHEEVVSPTLRLLAGRSDLDNVESAYRAALEEISAGKAADAVTDAGTALQEMLIALGCEGNALGPLISSARAKDMLAPHDSPMVNAVDKILNWVSADRSQNGDSHIVTSVTVDDAWFIVHVVGAAILRLSKSTPRAS